MTKHDKPSLNMIVRDGRLVPGSPYEAEVLDNYQNGAELVVIMHQPRSLPLHKKYWAVLRDVVENCGLPFSEAKDLSNAIKIKLGMIDVGKTFSGQRFLSVGSISFDAMDEAEFRRFYDKAMMVLAEATGIDPESLSDRYRHIPEQDASGDSQSLGEAAPDEGAATHSAPPPPQATEDGGNGAAVAPPADPAKTPDPAGGAHEPALVNSAKPMLAADIKAEMVRKLLEIAGNKSMPEQDRLELLENVRPLWVEKMPGFGEIVKQAFLTAAKVVKGQLKLESGKRFMEGL